MKKRTLYQELEIVDAALAELEERRTNIINRIDNATSERGSSKILQFPGRVIVKRSSRRSNADWPRGSERSHLTRDRP